MTQLTEGKKHVPFEARIASELKGLFVGGVNGEEIKWRDGIDPGPFEKTFHSPLAVLWKLYKYAGGMTMSAIGKEKSTFTGHNIPTPYPDYYSTDVAQVETDGNPSDMLDLILSDKAAEDSGLAQQIKEKVGSAKRIMLGGCIAIHSAANLIDRLQKFGFKGELDIYDLSEAPLSMIEAYKKAGFWKDIKITTRQRDLVGLSLGHDRVFNPLKKEESGYDFIFVDILGHYLTDEQMERLPVMWSALADKGILLLRDLAEYGQVENEKRILQKKGENFDHDEKKFNQWLKKEFGFNVSLEQIHEMRINLYSIKPDHGYRQMFLASWIDYLFSFSGANMQLLYRGLTVPSTGDDSRIFPMFVFQKRNKEQEYFFIKSPNKTSIALEV